jgi:cell wall-associated NlpC family hydrolase
MLFQVYSREIVRLPYAPMKKITYLCVLLACLTSTAPSRGNELPGSMLGRDAQALSDTYLEKMRDIIFYALSMVGINYRWGGSSPQTGFDCSGLVGHVFRQIAGLVLPRDSYAMARLGESVTLDDLKPGDLVFFNTMRRPFSHVGIYLGDLRFIHAPSAGKTVHVVDMRDDYWATRYNGARRLSLSNS